MSSEILRLGALLAYAEHQYGELVAQESSLKDHYDLAMVVATARLDGKMTETAKRGYVLNNDPSIEDMKHNHIAAESDLARWKGVRDGLRASYDAVSRVVTIRGMELEMARGA